jgi:hypothetical protein
MSELIERLKREAAFLDRSASMREAHLKDLLRDCKEALQQSQWVSVEDRLPESGIEVLTWGSHSHPSISYYSTLDSKWNDAADPAWLTGITHWMPLPTPPAKEQS